MVEEHEPWEVTRLLPFVTVCEIAQYSKAPKGVAGAQEAVENEELTDDLQQVEQLDDQLEKSDVTAVQLAARVHLPLRLQCVVNMRGDYGHTFLSFIDFRILHILRHVHNAFHCYS